MRLGEILAGLAILLAIIVGMIIETSSRNAWDKLTNEYDYNCELIACFDGMIFYADKMGGFYVRDRNPEYLD